jgi:hypothetical protein
MSVTNLFEDGDPTLANRYLAGQLTESERAAFETELESNRVTLRELEATARLKVGLERLRETGELDAMLRPTSLTRQLIVGLAATVALGVIGLSFLLGYVKQSHSSLPLLAALPAALVANQGTALPVAGPVAVFRKRQDSYDAVIELPATPQAIQIRVLPQVAIGADRYRVSLAHLRDDRSLDAPASVAHLRADADGFVTVFADASRLIPGQYRLAVSAEDGETEDPTKAESFLINVIPASKP